VSVLKSGPDKNKIMTSLQNKRLCAGIAAIETVMMAFANYLLTGHYYLSVIRDITTLVLLIWLFSGSEIARWIIGVLSCICVVIAVGGTVWIASHNDHLGSLDFTQQFSFVFAVLSVVALGFVGYRLVIWRPRELSSGQARRETPHNHP